jgi:two-component sensor histidine kinase/CheY-like chemotaxis protein
MPNGASSAPVRVLYVDDDFALVRLVQKSLGRRGYEIMHANDANEALAQAAAERFDIIALDHYLATGTGLEVLSQLCATEGGPPIVYVTGSSEMSVAVAALTRGAADFVPKTVGEDFVLLLDTAFMRAVGKARLRLQKESAEREVRAARDRAEVLLAEVNHRVANSLSVVASLVGLQEKAVTDEAARIALGETKARIFAISLVHKSLYTSGDVRYVALDEYLRSLLGHLETSMRSQGHGAFVVQQLAPIQLRTDASVSLGVVVTEWITNAFKYAYPGGEGEIRVVLRHAGEAMAELSIADDGIGKTSSQAPQGTGLGTRIVNAMATSMGADIEYVERNPGTLAVLRFPLQ